MKKILGILLLLGMLLPLGIGDPVLAQPLAQSACQLWQAGQSEAQVSALVAYDEQIFVGANAANDMLVSVYDTDGNLQDCSEFDANLRVEDIAVFEDQVFVAVSGPDDAAGLFVLDSDLNLNPVNGVSAMQAFDLEVADDQLYVATDLGMQVSPDWEVVFSLVNNTSAFNQVVSFDEHGWLIATESSLVLLNQWRILSPNFEGRIVTDSAVMEDSSGPIVLMVADSELLAYFAYPGGDPQTAMLGGVNDVWVDSDLIYVATQDGLLVGTLTHVMFTGQVELLSDQAFDQIMVYQDRIWAAGQTGLVELQ